MNREMKFRWYYDDDFRGRKGMFYFDFDSFGGDGQVFGLLNGIREEIYSSPRDVMQYTGLNDKNGKEIYLNDIVNMNEFWTHAVVEQSRLGTWQTVQGDGYAEDWSMEDWANCEVIGNVIENPNLLKHKPNDTTI